MKNFEIQRKELENVQKGTNHIMIRLFFPVGRKVPIKKVPIDLERKTRETGRAISLFLLKIGNSRG